MTFISAAGMWHTVAAVECTDPYWHPRIVGETDCGMSVLDTDHIVAEPDDGPWCPECTGDEAA